jgi:hypothetical protein
MTTILDSLQIRCRAIVCFIKLIHCAKPTDIPPFQVPNVWDPSIKKKLEEERFQLSIALLEKLLAPWSDYPATTPTSAIDLCVLSIALEMVKQWMDAQKSEECFKKVMECVKQQVVEFQIALIPHLKAVTWQEIEASLH